VCGRFTSSQRREAIGERFKVAIPETYQARYNLAPGQPALIVRERDEVREAAMAKWGLLPHWAKDARISFKMINARAETLTEKPAYRALLSRSRCLVVADGFYEWRIGGDGKKQPVHFHLRGFEPFAFAGLWTSRTDDASGEVLDSFTIITTRPNVLVSSVHDRMPVILTPEVERVWLDPSVSKEHALSLLRPFPTELMAAHPASPRANSIRNDDPGLLVPEDALAA
jgi:putative SOS response-associated peptidase YedK